MRRGRGTEREREVGVQSPEVEEVTCVGRKATEPGSLHGHFREQCLDDWKCVRYTENQDQSQL